jgi:SAM-dependent methyltransferase
LRVDPDSLERLVPDRVEPGNATGRETLDLHVARYRFAAGHVQGERLLDLACGVGYGTRLLADAAGAGTHALGVDVSGEAVAYATERYGREGVHYRVADAYAFEDPAGFDTIVSLETIEHLPDPERFVARLVGLLRPGGILVASVPTTPSVDANPHHLHDFTESSFRRLFTGHGLAEQDALRQVQPVPLGSLLRGEERRMKEVRTNLPGYYARHPGALLRRGLATLRYGFANHYLTAAWRAPS